MDTTSQEIYFQKIQELVQDDDKIVTVSSLTLDLGISLQNSRNLIGKYIEDHRKLKPDELAVTYVISGTLKENGKKGVFMAKEDDLEEKRNLFETNPFEVVYSVQKAKKIDFNIIALVDMFDSTKIRDTALNGSIVSKNCIKRTLKFKKLPSPPPPTLKGKSSFFVPKTEGTTSSEKLVASPKAAQKGKASGGIADLFKAAASKPKNGNNSAPTKSNKSGAKTGGLAGFLSNGALKSSKDTTNKKNSEKETIDIKTEKESVDIKTENSSKNSIDIEKEEIAEIMDVEFDEEPALKKDVEPVNETKVLKKDVEHVKERKVSKKEVEHVKETKVTKKDVASKNNGKKNDNHEKQKTNKRQRDKSKELPSKKRKRIIEKNDSDSDDMFEKEDDNDDIIERSDEESERVPSPVAQKPIVPKNRKRKAVTKTYQDEEGFVVTKTEYVYETASEDENVEPEPPKQNKKEEKPATKSKVAEKKKPAKNQSTLMNFFKKK